MASETSLQQGGPLLGHCWVTEAISPAGADPGLSPSWGRGAASSSRRHVGRGINPKIVVRGRASGEPCDRSCGGSRRPRRGPCPLSVGVPTLARRDHRAPRTPEEVPRSDPGALRVLTRVESASANHAADGERASLVPRPSAARGRPPRPSAAPREHPARPAAWPPHSRASRTPRAPRPAPPRRPAPAPPYRRGPNAVATRRRKLGDCPYMSTPAL
jgi:hypothetical protein